MLDYNDLEKWRDYVKEIEIIKFAIDLRVKDIYNKIFELAEVKSKQNIKINYDYSNDSDYCYDCGGCNTEINELDAFSRTYISVTNDWVYESKTINFIEISKEIINLSEFFPQRWLFNNFEQELIDGLNAYKDKVEAAKAKSIATKAKSKRDKVKLEESIKNKLSAEELELISFKKK